MTDAIAVLYISRIMTSIYVNLTTGDLDLASPCHG